MKTATPFRPHRLWHGGDYNPEQWPESIRLEGAETLATYGEGWYRSEPCVTRRHVGKGHAIYLGTDIEDAGLHAMYRGIAAELGLTRIAPEQEQIEFRERRADDGLRIVIVMNHAHEPRVVALGALAGTDLCTGRAIANTLQLPAHGTAVLEIDSP